MSQGSRRAGGVSGASRVPAECAESPRSGRQDVEASPGRRGSRASGSQPRERGGRGQGAGFAGMTWAHGRGFCGSATCSGGPWPAGIGASEGRNPSP